MFELAPCDAAVSDEEIAEGKVGKLLKGVVGVGADVNVLSRRVGAGQVVPGTGKPMMVVRGLPHNERATSGRSLSRDVVRRHDSKGPMKVGEFLTNQVLRFNPSPNPPQLQRIGKLSHLSKLDPHASHFISEESLTPLA